MENFKAFLALKAALRIKTKLVMATLCHSEPCKVLFPCDPGRQRRRPGPPRSQAEGGEGDGDGIPTPISAGGGERFGTWID